MDPNLVTGRNSFRAQSDNSESEGSESDFRAESDVFEESESDDGSDFSDASGSDDSGSDFGEGSDDDSGDDWDELERKAAKCKCSFPQLS